MYIPIYGNSYNNSPKLCASNIPRFSKTAIMWIELFTYAAEWRPSIRVYNKSVCRLYQFNYFNTNRFVIHDANFILLYTCMRLKFQSK